MVEKNTLRQILYILIFISFVTSSKVYGQGIFDEVVSLTNKAFNYMIKRDLDKYAFKSIIDQRQENNLEIHLDMTKGDFIFIVEYFSTKTVPQQVKRSTSILEIVSQHSSTCQTHYVKLKNFIPASLVEKGNEFKMKNFSIQNSKK